MFNKILYVLLCLPVFFLGLLSHFYPDITSITFLVLSGLYLILGIFFYVKHNTKALIWVIFLEGLLLKLFYIIYTPYTDRQHDCGNFSETSGGHFAYIYYILKNHTLPFFTQLPHNPVCHPPLHYILSALFLSVFSDYENLQYFTLILSFGCTVLSYLCLKFIFQKELYLIIAALFCSFFPAFNIYSGSLNNDILNTFLSIASIFYFMVYLKKNERRHLILSALCLGLSGLAKLSITPVVYLGVFVFFITSILMRQMTLKDGGKKLLLFSAVSLPIILIWPVYNYIRWDGYSVFSAHLWGYLGSWSDTLSLWFSGYNPFLHIEDFTYNKYQYVGAYSLFDRLGIIFEPISEPFILSGYEHHSMIMIPEYNIWAGLLKSALFDEYYIFFYGGSILSTIGFDLSVVLLYLTYILFIFFIIAFCKTSRKEPLILYHKSIILTVMAGFIYWCLKNPVWSAVCFRYIALLFPCLCFIFGKYVQDNLSSGGKWDARWKTIIGLTIFLFSWISFLIYALYGVYTI